MRSADAAPPSEALQRARSAARPAAPSAPSARVWRPALRGRDRREQRDHGLAAADVALQQPVHRVRRARSARISRPRAQLRAVSANGSASRARCAVGRRRSRPPAASRSRARGAAPRPSSSRYSSSSTSRAWSGVSPLAQRLGLERRRPGRWSSRSAAPTRAASSSRDRRARAGSRRPGRPRAQRRSTRRRSARGVHALGRGVTRHDRAAASPASVSGRQHLDFGVVQLLREAIAAHVARDEHARAFARAVRERVAAAEPLELHGAGLVGDERLEDARGRCRSGTHDRCGSPAREARAAPDLELLDRHELAAVVVARAAGGRADRSTVASRACARAPARASARRRARATRAGRAQRSGNAGLGERREPRQRALDRAPARARRADSRTRCARLAQAPRAPPAGCASSRRALAARGARVAREIVHARQRRSKPSRAANSSGREHGGERRANGLAATRASRRSPRARDPAGWISWSERTPIDSAAARGSRRRRRARPRAS